MSQYIKYVSSWVKNNIRYYNTVRELSQLTDRELLDLGMNRYDIIRVAGQQYQRDMINNVVNA